MYIFSFNWTSKLKLAVNLVPNFFLSKLNWGLVYNPFRFVKKKLKMLPNTEKRTQLKNVGNYWNLIDKLYRLWMQFILRIKLRFSVVFFAAFECWRRWNIIMGFELTGQLVWAVHTATNIFDLIIIFFLKKYFYFLF